MEKTAPHGQTLLDHYARELEASVSYWVPQSIEALSAHLKQCSVEVGERGSGEAKTLDHLYRELRSGECCLFREEGQLFRRVLGSLITITYSVKNDNLLLIEDRQVYRDGRERRRVLDFSVAEKMHGGESFSDAAHRALAEELGINEPLPLGCSQAQRDERRSTSYPGLVTHFISQHYYVAMPDKYYCAAGYIEEQDDKTSFFQWIPQPSSLATSSER